MFLRVTLWHVAALLVFVHGFLLTRIELPNFSGCNDIRQTSNSAEGCWTPGSNDKAVVVIIDALRYDFLINEDSSGGSKYTELMPKTMSTARHAGDAAAVLKFIADTPTITMSRLKALLTGGLPTFLDVGSSFSASTISEDNVVKQMQALGKQLVFMGDDTWMQLLPDAFAQQYPFPSFNVKDLHTVDDGVWKHLVPLLDQPQQWDVLVAHYLGVDHAGHTHGVRSPQMQAKVQQMDDQLEVIIDTMMSQAGPGQAYEHTMLLVMGDHGQTLAGDHGGSSAEETDSALVALHLGKYHARWQQRKQQGQEQQEQQEQQGEQCRAVQAMPGSRYLQLLAAGQLTAEQRGCFRAIVQVDLTPALALLLGVPIPYGNLGKVPVELWPVLSTTAGTTAGMDIQAQQAGAASTTAAGDPGSAGGAGQGGRAILPWVDSYADALAVNAWQVQRYLQAYSQVAKLPRKELKYCNELYEAATALHAAMANSSAAPAAEGASSEAPTEGSGPGSSTSSSSGQPSSADVAVAYMQFLEATFDLARRQFTQFNIPSMVLGFALMMAAVLYQAVATGRSFANGSWRVLLSPEGLLIPGMALVQAFSTFSVNYVMGEGRMQCYAVAAATMLLVRAALVASLRARASLAIAQQQVASAGIAAQDPSPQQQQVPAAGRLQGLQRLGQQCSVLHTLVYGCTMLACNVALQAIGLIDRSGQDPHDKSQPTVELLGPHGAAQLGWQQVARVQLPLLLIPAIFWYCHAALRRRHLVASQDGSSQKAAAGVVAWLAKLLGAAAAVEYFCISAYWHVQMFDTSKQLTLSGLLLSVSSSTSSSSSSSSSSAQVLPAQVQAWAAWLPGWLLDGVSITATSIGSMQLRLLLPQMVYGMALLAAVAVPVVLVLHGLLPGRKVQQQAWGASVLIAVVAVFSGPLVLVLGYAGPLTVLLGMLQACCCVGLLRQQLAAQVLCAACHEASSGHAGSSMPGVNGAAEKRKGDASAAASLASRAVVLARDIIQRQAEAKSDVHMAVVQGQGQYCGVGGAVWLLMSSQLFYCSQHFCEFTGLQYTSPFIGFDDMEYYRGFVMLSINSFGMYMIAALSLPLLAAAYKAHAGQLLSGLHQLGDASGREVEASKAVQASQCFQQAAGMFSVLRALCLCMSMLASIIMLRHILMWAIFAPKLVFEFWFAAWVDVFVLVAAWLAHRLLSH